VTPEVGLIEYNVAPLATDMGYIQPRQPGIVALCTGKQKDIGDDLSTGQVETRLVQRRYAVDSVLGGILGKMLSMSRSQHRWLFVGVPEDVGPSRLLN
jgi:hypothetical protein